MKTDLKNETGGGGVTHLKLSLIALAGLFASCVADFDVAPTPERKPEAETTDGYTIPIDDALDEMYDLMDALYGAGTRASHRDIATIETLKGSDLGGALTRSEGTVLPENILYVVNFANDGGFAVLGANQDVESVYCITESGSFDLEAMERYYISSGYPAGPLNPGDEPLAPINPGLEFKIPEWILANHVEWWFRDEDGNGIPDCQEREPRVLRDTDGDGLYDPQDPDDDDDGILDEEDPDDDNDGIPDEDDPDHDLYYSNRLPVNDELDFIPLNLDGTPMYPKTEYKYSDWWWYPSEKIEPMLTTRWHQGAPFNNDCKNKNAGLSDENVAAGCTPVALAQVVAYNEKPAPTKVASGVISTWKQLKAGNYDNQNECTTDTLSKDIAKIMYRMGEDMDAWHGVWFSGGATSATLAQAAEYMRDHLGYSDADKKNNIYISEIKSMLDRDCPVLVMGLSKGSLSNAHTWVIDGIVLQRREVTVRVTDLVPTPSGKYRTEVTSYTSNKTRELLHCNFGWGGIADGYYSFKVFDARKGPVDREVDDENYSEETDWYVNAHYRMITYTK